MNFKFVSQIRIKYTFRNLYSIDSIRSEIMAIVVFKDFKFLSIYVRNLFMNYVYNIFIVS